MKSTMSHAGLQVIPHGTSEGSAAGASGSEGQVRVFPSPNLVPTLQSSISVDGQTPASVPASGSPAAAQDGGSGSKPASKWGILGLLPPAASMQLLQIAAQTLKAHFLPIVIVYALKDLASFLLHRLSQRATNLASDTILGTSIGASSGNPWWLYLDSSFMEAYPAYQVVIVIFFLLALPLNIALSSAASATATLLAVPPGTLSALVERPDAAESHKKAADAEDLVALAAQRTQSINSTDAGEEASSSSVGSKGGTDGAQPEARASSSGSLNGASHHNGNGNGKGGADQAETASEGSGKGDASNGEGQGGEGSKPGLVKRVKLAMYRIRNTVPLAAGMWRRVWLTDLAFNAQAMPLQALSLLVVPVLWTVPRLLAIQLAVPVAILEGCGWREALSRSERLMTGAAAGMRTAYGWPFVFLILAMRFLDGARNLSLTAIPPRWWQDVVEVPILLTAAFSFAKLLVIRLHDLLPLAAYLLARRKEEGHADNTPQTILLPPTPPKQVPTI